MSIQLKKFQDQFDIPLTEVFGRQLYITEFGLEIAQIAQRISNEMLAIDYQSQVYKGVLCGKLKIAVVSTGKYVMPYFLNDFIQKYPNVDLEIEVTNRKKVLEILKNNEVDFALVSVLPDDFAVTSETLITNKLFLMGKKKADFNTTDAINVFTKIPMLFREAGSGTRLVMENYFKKNNIYCKTKMQLTSNEAVKQAVIAGLGFSVLPVIGCKNELKNHELHIINVAGFPIQSQWNLIALPNKKMAPVAETYLQFLQKEKEQITLHNFDWIHQY